MGAREVSICSRLLNRRSRKLDYREEEEYE